MKENLIGRVGRIVSGSFNSLIDAIENTAPETVMTQAIREIDEAIYEVRTELGNVVKSKHLANMRLLEENRAHEDLKEKTDLAIKEGRDDLAEAAISKQLDIEAQIPVLEETIADCSRKEKEWEGYVNALQAKKRQMKEELKTFQQNTAKTIPESGSAVVSAVDPDSNIDEKVSRAESAFDRVAEKATGVPGMTRTDSMKTASQLAELDDMARNNRIQERLAMIKGEIDKQ